MALRPKSYYDRLFMAQGFKILYMQSYDAYSSGCGAEMAEEVVYVLQTRGSSSSRNFRKDKDIEVSGAKAKQCDVDQSSSLYHTDI